MSERARPSATVRAAVCALLALAVLATYAGVRGCGFVELDDPQYVTGNWIVRRGLTWDGVTWAFTTGHAANWHPLTWLSHMLDVELFGLEPWGHHVTSVVLHAANAVLALLAFERLTRAFWRSAAVAALFALHPLRVESVAWVSERKDLLCAFFFLALLLAYARYVERPSKRLYGVALVLYALGLLSKPMLVTAPFVLLLLDAWPLRRLGSALERKRAVIEKLPFLALALGSSLATFWAQHSGGAVQGVGTIALAMRALNAVLSYGRYLQHFAWPQGLCAYYPYPRGGQIVALTLSAAVLVALSVFAFAGRARRPYLPVGWLWFLGMLVPVVGLVQVGSQAYADRYTYLPLLGIALALVWSVADALANARAPRWLGPALATAAIAACAWLSHVQVRFWTDSITLFERALAVTRENAFAHQSLGNALVDRGRLDEALVHLREALRLTPNFAYAHNGLGAALYTRGELDEAEVHLRRAIEIDPRYAAPRYNLGLALEQRGKLDEALECHARAAELDPWLAQAHAHLAKLLGSRGRLDEALVHYERARELQPSDHELDRWIAVTQTLLGRVEEAIGEYERLLRANPDDADALNNVAWIRATHVEAEHRDGVLAVRYAERVRELLAATPNAIVFDTLAAAYAEAGRFDDAVAACERAIALAEESGDAQGAARFRGHLARFKSGEALRGG